MTLLTGKFTFLSEELNNMEDYVKKDTFQWTIGTILFITGGIFSFCFGEIKEVRGELNAYRSETFMVMSEVKESVARIEGMLSGYDIEK